MLFDFDYNRSAADDRFPYVPGEAVYRWDVVMTKLQQIAGFHDGSAGATDVQEARPLAGQQLGFVSEPDDLQQKPDLLLLDSVDDVPYWKWVQRIIMKPLLENPETLVVVTSQSPLFWHFWELRDLCEAVELSGFSQDETRAYLADAHQDHLTRLLYQETAGYPRGLHYLTQLLQPPAHEPEVAPVALDSFTPETQQILAYTGFLRRIEIPVMHTLLVNLLGAPGGWQGDIPERRRLDQALVELRAAGYLEPVRKGQPLRFKPHLRHTLEQRWRRDSVDQYNEISTRLAKIYYERVYHKPISDIRCFNEWLYFAATHVQYDPQYRVQWQQELIDLLERVKLASPETEDLFFADDELLRKLQASGLLAEVEAVLQHHGVTEMTEVTETVPEMNVILDKYRETMLEQFKQSLPDDIREHLLAFLTSAAAVGPAFNVVALRKKLKEDFGLSPGIINEIIPVLHSRGFFTYDSPSRTYQLHPALRTLVAQIDAATPSKDAAPPASASPHTSS